MDGQAKARGAAVTVLTVAAGASIGLMFSVGGSFQPAWFWGTLGAYVLLVASAWAVAGRLGQQQADVERFKMPVRPETSTLPVETPRRQGSSKWNVEMPRRDGVVIPTRIAAALPAVEAAPEPQEVQLETEVVEPEVPAEPVPQGFTFRGFTLYERLQKGKPIRFFSKKAPVGGGRPIPMPEDYDVRWDGKQRKPLLVPPKVAEPEPAPEPEPLVEPVVAVRKPAPEPIEVQEFTAKPCSAMTSPGVFCNNPAKAGGTYCARHVGFKAMAEPTIEVAQDGAKRSGKAPKFALPEFAVRLDRASPKPTKAKKPKVVELDVLMDRATHKPSKAAKRRTVEVEIREAETHEMPQTRAREGRVEIREAQAHELPQVRPREGRVEIRAAQAHELPKIRPKEDRVEIRAAEAHELPQLRAKETTVVVRTARAERRPARAFKPRTVEVEIHADEAHMKPMTLSSAYDVTRAEVVTARGMPPARKPKKGKAPASSLVVQSDSKKRSSVGLDAPPRKGGRRRP